MTDFRHIILKLIEKKDLSEEESIFAMSQIMDGKVSNEKIASFLTALKSKGESVLEIASFAKILRNKSTKINADQKNLIDTAGTGGDLAGTFNISTCSAFAAAGAGAAVAKHGNRSSSGKFGSADVLEELGIGINITPQIAESQLKALGITFLFAPNFHPAMKNVSAARKELGFRTVFNALGPLTNPACAKRQLIGANDKILMEKMALAVKLLGTEKTILASSDIDEISISCESDIMEVDNQGIKKYTLNPEDFGFKLANPGEIIARDKKESAKIIQKVLKGENGAARDVTILNAGAAIYASGLCESIKNGIKKAEAAIDNKAALEKLERLRDCNGHTG